MRKSDRGWAYQCPGRTTTNGIVGNYQRSVKGSVSKAGGGQESCDFSSDGIGIYPGNFKWERVSYCDEPSRPRRQKGRVGRVQVPTFHRHPHAMPAEDRWYPAMQVSQAVSPEGDRRNNNWGLMCRIPGICPTSGARASDAPRWYS